MQRRNRLWLKWALVVSTLLWVTLAFARAGGGQNYSGGSSHSGSSSYSSSSHSSSSSSSSSSSGDGGIIGEILGFFIQIIIELLWDLTLAYPHVMVPLWLALLLFFAWMQYGGSTQRTSRAIAERTTTPEPEPEKRYVSLAELKQADPGFNEQNFLAQVRRTFLAVQQAWSDQTLPTQRALMSDGVLQRFLAQQALMRIEGVRNVMADVKVLDTRVHDLKRTASADVVDVLIEASARDMDTSVHLSDAAAKSQLSHSSAERFTEIWTFIRVPGATTKAGQAVQGKCPSCGAEYAPLPTGQCSFCNAVLNSGQHDWVLAEITQTSEYRPREDIEGASALLARDPDFNPYALEDRASLIFWKILLARAAMDTQGLARVGTAALLELERGAIEAHRRKHERKSYARAAVGGVEILRIEVGPEGDDLAYAAVRWSAQVSQVANGQQPSAAPTANFTSVITLVRSSKAKTLSSRGLATSRCNVCGGVVTDDSRVACEFCGTEIGPQRADWVALAMESKDAWQARQTKQKAEKAIQRPVGVNMDALPKSELERLLQTLVVLARADGVVSPAEDRMLRGYSTRWNIAPALVAEWLDAPQPPAVDLPPAGSPEADAFLVVLVKLALADGKIDAKERKLLDTVAEDLALYGSAVDLAIADVKGGRA